MYPKHFVEETASSVPLQVLVHECSLLTLQALSCLAYLTIKVTFCNRTLFSNKVEFKIIISKQKVEKLIRKLIIYKEKETV